ncbi:reticulon-4-interacting protein 1 homolog, mitochondrial [Cylas formicarius]|uniref:reticulon-4-interacting protein 1 homolog, mitochondrial n=1 Tax=Cylas formicarius TaxID=197179 RepID=UPI002958D110|nr:reticulon-4-interacting protein 1 homolog, mitochondrial [Cylas formicarius]
MLNLRLQRIVRNAQRGLSQQKPLAAQKNKMLAWCIHSYGDLDELKLAENRAPILNNPDDVLVEVRAASVNPIDSAMLAGYGRASFQVLRNFEIEFPLVLGRDFAGVIVGKGQNVCNSFKIGDMVYGFIPLHKQGSFAELVNVSQCYILPKPFSLTNEESASLVYATMTAWGALFLTGNLLVKQKRGLRVLVLGGSGGVGTATIQLLKSQGCVVYTTSSSDAIPLLTSLGADVVYDRNDKDYERLVCQEGKYHIILDAAKIGIENIPKSWDYETYITLNSPLLTNNDDRGLLCGTAASIRNLLENNVTRIASGRTVRWGFFVPSTSGFEFVDKLIRSGEIRPVIHKQFKFCDLPNAIQCVRDGHLRGKVVVNYE